MIPKIVTVFGGSGFLGRHIVRQLFKDGYRVRVAVRNPNVGHFLKPMGDVGQVQVMQANVKNEASVREALEDAEIAINLVGILYQTGRQKFQTLHAEVPGLIGRLAAETGCEAFVQMSAIGADPTSDSVYARTKAEGEDAARAAYPAVTVLRPSVVFGPEDGFLNLFASLSRFAPALPLIGGGKTKFQPVFVGDVARALSAALKNPQAAGGIYELGGPDILSFKEVLQLIGEITHRKRLLVPVPFFIANLQGMVLQLLPSPPLTQDQVKLLRKDNIVLADGAYAPDGVSLKTLADLGIADLSTVEAIAPTYLWRYRKHGQFAMTEDR
ncbi:MAG: complex I NDUFA9 subunit family protein [Pseudomonadota bacterium]